MGEDLFDLVRVQFSLAIFVMLMRWFNWLAKRMPEWDTQDRVQFELQCHKDKLVWELDRSTLQDGLIVFLIRGFFYPLHFYHQSIYLWLLTGCAYVAWLMEQKAWRGPEDLVGEIRFKMAVDVHNITWSALLIGIYTAAFVCVPGHGESLTWFAWTMELLTGLLALFRLYEVLGVTIRLHFKENYHTRSAVRALVNTLWHYAFMSVIFAILYLNAAVLSKDRFAGDNEAAITEAWSSPLYFSMVTLATIGYGDFHPTKWLGQGLVCFEVLIGLLLIVLVIARVVSMMGSSKGKD